MPPAIVNAYRWTTETEGERQAVVDGIKNDRQPPVMGVELESSFLVAEPGRIPNIAPKMLPAATVKEYWEGDRTGVKWGVKLITLRKPMETALLYSPDGLATVTRVESPEDEIEGFRRVAVIPSVKGLV